MKAHDAPAMPADDITAATPVRTIADLARLAGVTPGTVSRALAGKALVNEVTRARIRALADAHGFRPNQLASRLRTQRTGVVGIVVPLGHERHQLLSDPFFMAIFAQLADQLAMRDYDVMLSRAMPDGDDWLERIAGSGMVDGLFLIGQSDQQTAIDRLAAHYRPVVSWGAVRKDQRCCTVGSDNRTGGRLAAKCLIARGATRIAFLGSTIGPEIAARFDGVVAALAEAGLPPPLHVDAPLASAGMVEAVDVAIGEMAGQVDGIVAASDLIAVATIRAATQRGLAVPRTLAVTGFDDLPIATQVSPALTTVRQDIAGGAAAMTDALFRRMAGEDAPSVEMRPMLAARESA